MDTKLDRFRKACEALRDPTHESAGYGGLAQVISTIDRLWVDLTDEEKAEALADPPDEDEE
jgi:hypothetical protein